MGPEAWTTRWVVTAPTSPSCPAVGASLKRITTCPRHMCRACPPLSISSPPLPTATCPRHTSPPRPGRLGPARAG